MTNQKNPRKFKTYQSLRMAIGRKLLGQTAVKNPGGIATIFLDTFLNGVGYIGIEVLATRQVVERGQYDVFEKWALQQQLLVKVPDKHTKFTPGPALMQYINDEIRTRDRLVTQTELNETVQRTVRREVGLALEVMIEFKDPPVTAEKLEQARAQLEKKRMSLSEKEAIED